MQHSSSLTSFRNCPNVSPLVYWYKTFIVNVIVTKRVNTEIKPRQKKEGRQEGKHLLSAFHKTQVQSCHPLLLSNGFLWPPGANALFSIQSPSQPSPLSSLLTPWSPKCTFQSSDTGLWAVRETRYSVFSVWVFSLAVHHAWNALPPSLHLLTSLSSFKSKPKSHLL